MSHVVAPELRFAVWITAMRQLGARSELDVVRAIARALAIGDGHGPDDMMAVGDVPDALPAWEHYKIEAREFLREERDGA